MTIKREKPAATSVVVAEAVEEESINTVIGKVGCREGALVFSATLSGKALLVLNLEVPQELQLFLDYGEGKITKPVRAIMTRAKVREEKMEFGQE